MAREWFNDYRNRANQRFGTVDGEGGNIDDESALFGKKHEYLLLRADEFELNTGRPLRYPECFDFLASLPRKRIWTWFFGDYDAAMMCRGLSEERARKLIDPTLRQTRGDSNFPFATIDIDDRWEIGYLPKKEFRVRIKGQSDFTVISDTGPFFQTSFVRVLDLWDIGSKGERESIKVGKEARADFVELTDDTREYNALECILHNSVMERFRQTCKDVGYVPTKWQGPGHLASAMLKAHHIPKRDDIPIMSNWHFREIANAGYYGGRAETTAVGNVPGPIVQLDINGAYVDALRYLPCLLHGSWRLTATKPARGEIWIGEIQFSHDRVRLIYNLPVRRVDGNIFFPRRGSGFYWSWEIDAAEHAGTQIQFLTGWVYEKHCDCKPFSWIDAFYAERLRLGKSARGIVLKLGGNSIYGKIAQSIGYAPWANPVWAGLITAYCRARIIYAYEDDPDDVLMIMTDGLFRRSMPNVAVSKALGEWEKTVHDSLFIVQPGIYFLPQKLKTRGVPHGRIVKAEGEFREAAAEFSRTLRMPAPISIPVHNFITMRQALARNKWHLAGTWENTTRDVGFDFSTKRSTSGMVRETDTGVLRTMPIESDVSVSSHPYDRMIGGGLYVSPAKKYKKDSPLEAREDETEQPDWNEPLVG